MPNKQPTPARGEKRTEKRRWVEMLEEEKQNMVKILTEVTQEGHIPWGHVPDRVKPEVERVKRVVDEGATAYSIPPEGRINGMLGFMFSKLTKRCKWVTGCNKGEERFFCRS